MVTLTHHLTLFNPHLCNSAMLGWDQAGFQDAWSFTSHLWKDVSSPSRKNSGHLYEGWEKFCLLLITKHAVISAEPGFHLLGFKSLGISLLLCLQALSTPAVSLHFGNLGSCSFPSVTPLPTLSRITKNTRQLVFYFLPVSMGKIDLLNFLYPCAAIPSLIGFAYCHMLLLWK